MAQFLREFRTRRQGALEHMLLAAGVAVLVLIASWYFVFHGRVGATTLAQHPANAVALSSFEIFRDCPTCPLMKVMPRGRFNQGSAADDPDVQPFAQPQHPVAIARAFGIGVYEVTVGEFSEFVDATQRKITGCTVYDGQWHERTDLSWSDVGYPQTSSHPVACVSWRDALDYNDGYVFTAPVGSFHPNAFGLYDMLGNVFEWVQDCWHANYVGSPSNGSAWLTGDCSQHDLRGGSWFTSPQYVSVAARNRFDAGYRSNTIGFRLVREL